MNNIDTSFLYIINDKHKVKKEVEQRRCRQEDIKKKRTKKVHAYYALFILLTVLVIFVIIHPLNKKEDCFVSYTKAEDMNSCTTLILQEQSIDDEFDYTKYEYLAKCVLAEAGNQDELGKRLVIDVILNRVDNTAFPNTINEVINQSGQFNVVESGAINKQVPDEYIYSLIEEELNDRTDSEVLYFKTLGYHYFAEPVLEYQDHYFSK